MENVSDPASLSKPDLSSEQVSQAVSAAIGALQDSSPIPVRILPEKAGELEAAVRFSLRILPIPENDEMPGKPSSRSRSCLGRAETWPAVAGLCSLVSLRPLGVALEPLVTKEGVGVLHAEQTFELLRIPRDEEQLTASATLSKSRQMRGSYILQVVERLQDSEGKDVTIGSSTLFVGGQRALRHENGSRRSAPGASASTENRRVVASSIGVAGPVELARYGGASGDFNPIHFDAGYATKAGFARPIVHGMLIYNWVIWTWASLLKDLAPSFKTKIRFVNPLLTSEPATVNIYDELSFEVFKESSSEAEPVAKGSIRTY